MGAPFAYGGHLPEALPGLAKCAGDARLQHVTRRIALGRELAARLVASSFDACPGAEVARWFGLGRNAAHHWLDATRPGPPLSYILGGPAEWRRYLIGRAAVLVDGPTPRWSASPQALVARVVAGAAQVAAVIEQRDLDQCSPEELEQMRRTVAEKRGDLAELERQIAEAQERKRQQSESSGGGK